MRTKTLSAACFAIVSVIIFSNDLKAQSWRLVGNAGIDPSINFIGTTDAKNFVIRTKNTQRINVTSSGNIVIGTGGSPGELLNEEEASRWKDYWRKQLAEFTVC